MTALQKEITANNLADGTTFFPASAAVLPSDPNQMKRELILSCPRKTFNYLLHLENLPLHESAQFIHAYQQAFDVADYCSSDWEPPWLGKEPPANRLEADRNRESKLKRFAEKVKSLENTKVFLKKSQGQWIL